MRKPVVGVMGGSKATPAVAAMARQLGSLIAQRGWVVLNGGRNRGVMAASARGAKEAGGTVIGILPDGTMAKASPDLDFAIVTGMHVIACPGALGTMSEVALALKHDKRVVLLGFDVGLQFDRYRKSGQLTCADDPQDAVEQAAGALAEAEAGP